MIHIYHHNDPDGCMSAAIWAHYLNDDQEINFIELDYDSSRANKHLVDHVDGYKDGVVILDFSFSPEQFETLLNKMHPAQIVWIDHHITAIEVAEENGYSHIPGIRYTESPYAACYLTWYWFYKHRNDITHEVPLSVSLVSYFDTWAWIDRDDSEIFRYFITGLRANGYEPENEIWGRLLEEETEMDTIHELCEIGHIASEFEDAENEKNVRDNAYITEIDGLRGLVVNTPKKSSIIFDTIDPEDYDIDVYIRFHYDGDIFVNSIYAAHDDVPNLGEIAQKRKVDGLSGGGHYDTAGFPSKKPPEKVEEFDI